MLEVRMEKRQQLNLMTGITMLTCIGYVVITIILLDNEFIGFNGLCSAIIYVLYSVGALVVLNKTPSHLSFGMLIGAASMVTLTSFQHAIYWASLADKQKQSHVLSIQFACGLTSIICFLQVFFLVYIVNARKQLISQYGGYEYIDIPSAEEAHKRTDLRFSSIHI